MVLTWSHDLSYRWKLYNSNPPCQHVQEQKTDSGYAKKEAYISMLISLAITSEDLTMLSRGIVPPLPDWEYLDVLDEQAKSFMGFLTSGQNVPKYTMLKDLITNERCSIAALVEDAPRIVEYTDRSGIPAKFASLWVRDCTGTRELMFWDKDDVALAQTDAVRKGTILLILGAKLVTGKQGHYLSLASPHVIKFDPQGFKAKHFEPGDDTNVNDITALSDLEECNGFVVNVRGVLTEKGRTTTFTRKRGGNGKVSHVRIFDSSATANVTLWDEAATAIEDKDMGVEVTLTALRVRMENAGLTLHSTNSSKVL